MEFLQRPFLIVQWDDNADVGPALLLSLSVLVLTLFLSLLLRLPLLVRAPLLLTFLMLAAVWMMRPALRALLLCLGGLIEP